MSRYPFLSLAVSHVARLDELQKAGKIALDGHSLDIAGVVATARAGCMPVIDSKEILMKVPRSAEAVREQIQQGLSTIYGVHTGFGGSADTRTNAHAKLAVGLMQLLQNGVLTENDMSMSSHLQHDHSVTHSMPSAWTRATMTVRINQCIRGHSAIPLEVIELLLQLMKVGITPIIPSRGTISASGDLLPLSYIAGMLEGSPDVYVWRMRDTSSQVMSAQEALADAGLGPLKLGAREALGLVNGTAASATIASLAMADAMQLMLMSTAVTCLVSEALAARVEWLHPFIAETRPHPGQIEVAGIMRTFLRGSQLVSGLDLGANSPLHWRPDGGLAQDRYPLRTSPQWLGPQIEDLLLAHSQISIELNSTSDNPLTNPETGSIHHGGNFQAVSITSAVEKIRSCLQMCGKLICSQSTEMMNHQMNAGLPPNLAADEPSVSFCCKGLDISIAAYQSELSYLANSISNHVQSAEMHNQAVNSLAFLSTRYTIQAVELLSLMTSSVLYAACQAVDLRVLHATFLNEADSTLCDVFARLMPNGHTSNSLRSFLAPALRAFGNAWWAHSALDSNDRCSISASAFAHAAALLPEESCPTKCGLDSMRSVHELQTAAQEAVMQAYRAHRDAFMEKPSTVAYLGVGSKALYCFVRSELEVPMHRGLEHHPVAGGTTSARSIGSLVSRLYHELTMGKLMKITVEVVKEDLIESQRV